MQHTLCSQIPVVDNSVVFATAIKELLEKYLDNGILKTLNTEMPFVKEYVTRNTGREDEVGAVIKDINENLMPRMESLEKKTRTVKLVFGLIIVAVIVVACIAGQ